MHVRDKIIPHVERVAFPGEQPGNFLIRCQRVHRRTTPLQRLDIRAKYQLVGRPCPLGPKSARLGCLALGDEPPTSSAWRASFVASSSREGSSARARSSNEAQAS